MNGDHMTGSVLCMFCGGNSAKLNTAVLNIFTEELRMGSKNAVWFLKLHYMEPIHEGHVRSGQLNYTSHHLTSHKERDRLSAVCLLRLSWWKLSWVNAARAAAGVHVGGKQQVNQWLHQRLCYLHFSFLLGCVCDIHHCCFCISVHCGASWEEKEGEWDTANKRVGHINTGPERVCIVPVGEADASRFLRCPTEPLCLCESITAITTLAALQTRWCLYRHIASLPSVD